MNILKLFKSNRHHEEEKLMISKLVYVNGSIDMIASHPVFHLLMDEASRMFDLNGAINFLSMTGTDKKGRNFDITIQLCGGKTPSQLLIEQDSKIKDLTLPKVKGE